MVKRSTAFGWVLLALALLAPTAAKAQLTSVSPQVSFGDKADVGIGARFGFDASSWSPDVEVQVGFDLFFPNDPPGVNVGYFEANANVVRHFRLADHRTLIPYAGGGFNFGRRSASSSGISFSATSDVDLGLNILGGVRFDKTQYDPFVELRFELGGGDQGVLTGGLRIPV